MIKTILCFGSVLLICLGLGSYDKLSYISGQPSVKAADPVPPPIPPIPPAKPSIKIPATLTVKPGRALIIEVDTNGSVVKWNWFSKDADLIPFESTKKAVFTSPISGTYKILAYTALGDMPSEPAICDVTVEGAPPAPDSFASLLIDAYKADTTVDKQKKLATLVIFWKDASTTTVNEKDITTVGMMKDTLHTAAVQLLGDDLSGVRDVIGKELNSKLPVAANAVIDDGVRKLMSDQFKRIYDALTKIN